MIGKDGSTWNVQSDSVRLAEHVGHMVRVTGAVSTPALHGAKEDVKEKVEKNPNENGNMTVTNLKMVSKSCRE